MLEELASTFPILTCILFLPVIGAAVLWLFEDEDMVRTSALTIALPPEGVPPRAHFAARTALSPAPRSRTSERGSALRVEAREGSNDSPSVRSLRLEGAALSSP